MAFSVTSVWSVTASTSGANAPSASKAAGSAGVQHVADRVIISFAANSTAQPPVAVNLRDGATGAGTILCSWQVAVGGSSAAAATAPAIACLTIDSGPVAASTLLGPGGSGGLNLPPGTAATAMTLEFAAAPAAASQSAVTLIGHDIVAS